MGIYESIQRNQGNIDSIAGLVQGGYKRSERRKKREEIEALLTEENTELAPEYKAALRTINSIGNNMEVPIPQGDIAARTSRALSPQGPTRPSVLQGPQTQTVKRMRTPTAQDAFKIGEINDMGPDEIMQLMFGLTDREQRSTAAAAAAKRGRLLNVGDGQDVIDIETGKPVYQNDRSRVAGNPSTGKSWVVRGGRRVFDFPQSGDEPYNKPAAGSSNPSLGKSWVTRGGKPVYDVPGPNDRPYDKPTAGEGKISRTVTYTKPDGKQGIKTYAGEPRAVIEQIGARLNAIDELAAKSGKGKGGGGFLGIGSSSSWNDFKAGNVTFDDLDPSLQSHAAEYAELESQLEDLQSMSAEDGAGGGDDDGSFTLQDVRAQYPNLSNKTDQEIIDAYANQGITIKP